MYDHPFHISIETLIGSSRILGHGLEDRAVIRDRQDQELLRELQEATSTQLRDASQMGLFSVAPIDMLVSQQDKQKRFHVIEINGTGMGGLTNMSSHAVGCVLQDLTEWAEGLPGEHPVVMVASSGTESVENPRQNKLIHEKILYAEALLRGLRRHGAAQVTTMAQLRVDPRGYWTSRPTIVLGYMKQFLDHLHPEADGSLMLFDWPVAAAVNDRFCLNIAHRFGANVEMGRLQTMNRCFRAGADKGIAYELLNEFVAANPHSSEGGPVRYHRAHTREELIETVEAWVRAGRRAVIKPQGTGLGHGIEFFLSADESRERIALRVDHSLSMTEAFYGLRGGALPYTVCEFIDTCTVGRPGHVMEGHKYEIRIVVYRDGMSLKPFPSIAKVSSEVYDSVHPSHLSLINNITASSAVTGTPGVEHMLPLCNHDNLDLLGLSKEELTRACQHATAFMRYVIDRTQDEPTRFGADRPARSAVPGHAHRA